MLCRGCKLFAISSGLITSMLTGLASAEVHALLTPIALIDGVAAGVEGERYTSFPIWSHSSSDGRLTWQANMSNGQEGLWVYDENGSRPVAIAGPGAAFESFFNQGSGFINSKGQITLVAERGAEQDILVIDGAATTTVLSTDDQAPGLPFGVSIAPGSIGVLISDEEIVTFGRGLEGPGVTTTNNSSWWIGRVEAPRLLIREGDPAPGVPGDRVGILASGFSVNDSGFAVISDRTQADRGVVWAGTPGDLQLVAIEGASAPDLPDRFLGSFVNQVAHATTGDKVLFSSPLVDASLRPMGDALFAGRPGALESIVATGDPSPLGGEEMVLSLGTPSVNDVGTALVTMTLQGISGDVRQVLVSFDLEEPSDASLIAEVGDLAPGAGVAFSSLLGGQINDQGDVLFTARLEGFGSANFGHGYWLKPSTRPIQVVSYVGQTVEYLQDGELTQQRLRIPGIPTRLADNGTVGLRLGFDQGGGGLFLASSNPAPEPNALVIQLIGCLALLTRRMRKG